MNHVKGFFKGLLRSENTDSEREVTNNEETNSEQVFETARDLEKDDEVGNVTTDMTENYNSYNIEGEEQKEEEEDDDDEDEVQNVSVINEDLLDEMMMAANEADKEQDDNFNILEAIHEESKKHVEEALKEQADTQGKPLSPQEAEEVESNETEQKILHDIDTSTIEPNIHKTTFTESQFPERQVESLMEVEQMIMEQDTADNNLEIQVLTDKEQSSEPKKLIFTPYEPENNKPINDLTPFDIQRAKTPYLQDEQINALINKPTDTDLEEGTTEPPRKKKKIYIPAEIKGLSRSIFTPEEDELIKEYVRRNPHLKMTHKLYQRIGEVLSSHTGNSIRSRFFNTLLKDLDYVYEINPKTGDLLTDSEGNYIKTTQLPGGVKKSFTAEEDYLIALAVKCIFYLTYNNTLETQIDPLNIEPLKQFELEYYTKVLNENETYIDTDPNIECKNGEEEEEEGNELAANEIPSFAKFRCNGTKGPTTRKFFNQMSARFPQHTPLSWRDRHDKFMKKFGIDKFISYYNRCVLLGLDPQPIKELTSTRNKAILELEKNPAAGTLEELEMRFKRKNNYSGNYNREHTNKP